MMMPSSFSSSGMLPPSGGVRFRSGSAIAASRRGATGDTSCCDLTSALMGAGETCCCEPARCSAGSRQVMLLRADKTLCWERHTTMSRPDVLLGLDLGGSFGAAPLGKDLGRKNMGR
jgi:hypothetical protein